MSHTAEFYLHVHRVRVRPFHVVSVGEQVSMEGDCSQVVDSILDFDYPPEYPGQTHESYHQFDMRREPWTPEKSDECENKRDLRNLIESNYGLLDELLMNEFLTRRECQTIQAEKSTLVRNDMLLDHLSDAPSATQKLFEDGLVSTGQQHVVNYINGGHDDNSDWPLDEGQRSKIERNADMIAQKIFVSEMFLMMLFSNLCITSMQKADLQMVSDPSWLLLDILRRRSVKNYETFIQILRHTGQDEAAEILIATPPSRYDPSNPLDQWLGIQHATESSSFDFEDMTTCEHNRPNEWFCELILSNEQPDGQKMVASQTDVLNQVETRQLDAERVRILLHMLLFLYGGS